MLAIGVIPARYGSTRLPAKPLLKINGRPLLEWVVRGASQSKELDKVIVATDHPEIEALAKSLGVEVVMTSPDLPSGSDRVSAAAAKLDADIVLNIQGDEVLVQPHWLDGVVRELRADPKLEMATIAKKYPVDELDDLNSVKVIMNKNNEAIYFSRYPIPYSREKHDKYPGICLKHIGIYGYRKSFLEKFCKQEPTALERAESLEQLRALYLGAKIKVVEIEAVSVEINTADDVTKVEKLMADRGQK